MYVSYLPMFSMSAMAAWNYFFKVVIFIGLRLDLYIIREVIIVLKLAAVNGEFK